MKKTIKLVTVTTVMLCLMFVFSVNVDAQNVELSNQLNSAKTNTASPNATQGNYPVGTIVRTGNTATVNPIGSLKSGTPVNLQGSSSTAGKLSGQQNQPTLNIVNPTIKSGNVVKLQGASVNGKVNTYDRNNQKANTLDLVPFSTKTQVQLNGTTGSPVGNGSRMQLSKEQKTTNQKQINN